MKAKHLLLVPVLLMLTVLTVVAQDVTEKKISVPSIPFGKKLPLPDLTAYSEKFLPLTTQQGINSSLMQNMPAPKLNAIHKSPDYYRQLFLERKKKLPGDDLKLQLKKKSMND